MRALVLRLRGQGTPQRLRAWQGLHTDHSSVLGTSLDTQHLFIGHRISASRCGALQASGLPWCEPPVPPEAVQEWVAEQNWSLTSLPSLGTLGPFLGQGQMWCLPTDTSQKLGRDRWDHGGCRSICRGADFWPWGLGHGQSSAQQSSQHCQRLCDVGCHPQHRWSLRRREAVYKEEFVRSPFLQ